MSPPTSFNKAKALEEAAKLVSQRKIPQAIKHYLAISEHDPSDLSLLNTIGDLCIRDGNTAEALRQFQKLADAYTQEGFLLKAVAIHKKISKLVPNDVEPLLKLAGHYSNLGLGREAREHYMQALALCERQGLNHKALEILRKLVKQEPENLAYRVRLGESCVAVGQNGPAAQVYAEIAAIAYQRGELAAVEQPLQRAQQLDAVNVQANLLSGRLALDAHQTGRAKEILQSSLALRSNPEAARLLLDVHFLEGNFDAATEVVTGAFRTGGDSTGILAHYVQACLSASDPDAALKPIREIAREALDPNVVEAIREPLRLISGKHPDHLPSLELLVQALERTPGGEELAKAVDGLSSAYLRANQKDQAENLYRQLLSRDPENALWQARLTDILQTGARPQEVASAEELKPGIAEPEEELENPQVEEALENASIFARYGLIDKALDELDRALQSAPDNLKLLRQTIEVSKQDRPKRAAQAAEALAELLRERGDLAGVAELEELNRRLQTPDDAEVALQFAPSPEPSGFLPHMDSPTEPAADQLGFGTQPGAAGSISPVISELAEQQVASSASAWPVSSHRASVSQIDLTEEVEALASIKTGQVDEAITPAADIFAEEQAEIAFYLEYGFFVEAQQAAGALAEKFPNHPGLPALQRSVEQATQSSLGTQEEVVEGESEAAPPATEAGNGAGTLQEESAQDLTAEVQLASDIAAAESPAFQITPIPEELERQPESQVANGAGGWISETQEEARAPAAELTPVEELPDFLNFEWTSTGAAPTEGLEPTTEAEPSLSEPAPVEEFPLVTEATPVAPDAPPAEEIYTASKLASEPVPLQPPSEPVLVEEPEPASEVMEAAPEPPAVEEHPPTLEIISRASEPPPVEERHVASELAIEATAELPVAESAPPDEMIAPEVVEAVSQVPAAGELPPVPDFVSTVPEPPAVEESVPAPEPVASAQEAPAVKDLTPVREAVAASPEPLPVEEYHPAPELPAEAVPEPTLPLPVLIEEPQPEPQPITEALPIIAEPSPVEVLQPASQIASVITEPKPLEEPPPVAEITTEPGAEGFTPEATAAGKPSLVEEEKPASERTTWVETPPAAPEPESVLVRMVPVEEPPRISQPAPMLEPVVGLEAKLAQPLEQQEAPSPPLHPPEAPVKVLVKKPASPFPDLQALIIDSTEDAPQHEADAVETGPPVAKEQSAAQGRPAPKRPAASFNQILQELSGDLAIVESPDSPEKHYNLGLAFREMDLIDEAIGEFQKVVRGSVKSNLPPRFLEACSLLAACFMQKSMPSIAVKWYQRALDVPGVEGDALLALNYDLADAMDRAGQKKPALEKFMEVYSENIDYRDVADRIRALQHNPA